MSRFSSHIRQNVWGIFATFLALTMGTAYASSHLIGTDDIQNGAVTTPKLAAEAVTTGRIAPNAVTGARLNDGAVTQAKLQNGATGTDKIQSGAVTRPKIADAAITGAKLAPNSVGTARIIDGAVTAEKLDPNAIFELEDGSVTTSKLADGAVDSAKILDGSVSAQHTAPALRLQCPLGTRLLAGGCLELTPRGAGDFNDADAACRQQGRRLPSLAELQSAAQDGFAFDVDLGDWSSHVFALPSGGSAVMVSVVVDRHGGWAPYALTEDFVRFRCVATPLGP